MTTEFKTVAKVGDIPEGEGRAYDIGDYVVAVFLIDGQYTAIDDMCPHMGASLVSGFLDTENCTVTCPWHAWRFNVKDGAWADNPRVKTDVFDVRIVGDEIQVSADKQKPESTVDGSSPAPPDVSNE